MKFVTHFDAYQTGVLARITWQSVEKSVFRVVINGWFWCWTGGRWITNVDDSEWIEVVW